MTCMSLKLGDSKILNIIGPAVDACCNFMLRPSQSVLPITAPRTHIPDFGLKPVRVTGNIIYYVRKLFTGEFAYFSLTV